MKWVKQNRGWERELHDHVEHVHDMDLLIENAYRRGVQQALHFLLKAFEDDVLILYPEADALVNLTRIFESLAQETRTGGNDKKPIPYYMNQVSEQALKMFGGKQ